MCMNQFFSSIYSATQHTSHSFWTSLVAAVVNLLLNWILIGKLGITGAGIATFASYFVSYVIRVRDARRYVPFPVDHTRFALNLVILFLLSAVSIYTPPGWKVMLAIGLLFTVGYNFNAITSTMRRIIKR